MSALQSYIFCLFLVVFCHANWKVTRRCQLLLLLQLPSLPLLQTGLQLLGLLLQMLLQRIDERVSEHLRLGLRIRIRIGPEMCLGRPT